MSAAAPDPASPHRHIVVFAYPDVMAIDSCGPMEAFAMMRGWRRPEMAHFFAQNIICARRIV
jgi:hypothetical protein